MQVKGLRITANPFLHKMLFLLYSLMKPMSGKLFINPAIKSILPEASEREVISFFMYKNLVC